jgi:hypothetical protein
VNHSCVWNNENYPFGCIWNDDNYPLLRTTIMQKPNQDAKREQKKSKGSRTASTNKEKTEKEPFLEQ